MKTFTTTNTSIKNSELTYNDLLENMGLCLINNELHVLNNSNNDKSNDKSNDVIKNSYIYNKLFKNEINNDNTPTILVPKNLLEYRNMLLKNIIQQEKNKRSKSRNLIIQTHDNINININKHTSSNKLFNFSNRK